VSKEFKVLKESLVDLVTMANKVIQDLQEIQVSGEKRDCREPQAKRLD